MGKKTRVFSKIGKAEGMAEASIFLELNLELPGCL